MNPDWSQLPEELLHLISKYLENYCFDVIHARSVCRLWRSTFPFPCYLLSPRYSLPTFQSKDLCTLYKVPLFLFRVRDPVTVALPFEYFLGGVSRDDHMEFPLPSPLQCTVKVEILGSLPTLTNMLDCQIFPLGHQYRMIGWEPEWMRFYKDAVFLPLNEEGEGREFVVLLRYFKALLVLTSAEMRWKRLQNIPDSSCENLVTFRGRIYATFDNGDIFVFDPYSLQGTRVMPPQPLHSLNYLISCGNDEIFLVEKYDPIPEADVLDFARFTCRVSRLDDKAGEWVVVSDLGDRVLFINGHFGNVSCSAKESSDGCGMTGNSILFTNRCHGTYFYKYGVEDELNTLRYSIEKRVLVLNSFKVVALWPECETGYIALDT